MHLISHTSFFITMVFVGMAVYVLSRGRGQANMLFALLCLAFANWSLGFTFFVDAETREAAWWWYHFSSPGWCFGPALLLHFFLTITEWRPPGRRPWLALAIYLPAAVFQVKQLSGELMAVDLVLTPLGWDEVFDPGNLWGFAYAGWYSLLATLGLVRVHRWGRTGTPMQRKQAQIIVGAGAIVLVAVSISNVVMRYLGVHIIPGLAPILVVLWPGAILHAIRKYRFLTLTPQVAAQDIVQTMAEALLLVGPRGEVIEANRSAEELFRRDGEPLEGQSLEAVLGHDEELFDGDGLHEALARGELRNHDVHYHGHPDGPKILSLSATRVDDEGGANAGAVVCLRDITEQLEMHVRLSRAEQDAQNQRLATVGMLAAGVAHEVNNPLSFIIGNLEYISDELALQAAQQRGGAAHEPEPLDFDELASASSDAIEGARRVRDIVKGLKTFARVEGGQGRDVTLDRALDTALGMAQHEIKHRARVRKVYAKTPPVLANEGKLCQVFLNLIINAGHALEEGRRNDNLITLSTRQEGEVVVAEVRDTGSGIPDRVLPRLFDPFFTTKEDGTGTGLGLSICKNIIEAHGGEIDVESALGQGTCFSVRLPAAQEPCQAEEAEETADSAPGQARVLVVDDEAMVLSALRRALNEHRLTTVGSGQAAMELLGRGERFDVILSDLIMPHGSGTELYRWIEENRPELKRAVLFMSGGAYTSGCREFLAEVEVPLLEKPLDLPQLRRALERVMD